MAVCLHCLHAARVEARERRQRLVIRASLWTLAIAVVGAVGAAATGAALRGPSPRRPAARSARRTAATVTKRDTVQLVAAMPVVPQGSPETPAPSPRDTIAAQIAAVAPARSAPNADSIHSATSPTAVQPVLAAGRTDMPDSLYAERMGDTVVVHFDTSPTRTRRADKFERIVRQTLHTVYGPVADTLLGTVPEGQLAAPGELLTVLPRRGIHLATVGGRKIVLWPETRPGRDGPLVVSYRTIAER